VVYLLHGSPGRPQDWFHGGNASRFGEQLARTGHPTILVAPQLSRSWTDDPECVDGRSERVESHFIDHVIPTIDTQLRTIPQRESRVFAGMSAGGYCALNLGLRHRNLVATIVDLSGYTVPTHDHGAASLFGRSNPLAAQLVAANSPALYVADLPNGPACRIWLDTGLADHTIERQMAAVAPQLRRHGMDVAWRVRHGGHDYRVWNAALSESLPWALGAPPGHDKGNPSRPGP
jgi:enterochelin esterase-like enzyme